METKLIEKEAVQAKFEVTIPAAEVDKAYATVLRSVARQVRVPGFRPGKAPKGVLIKRIGQDALNEEVKEAIVDANYPKAIRELELSPIHAHFHGDAPAEGNDYKFEVHVELFPEIELPDLNEIVIDTTIEDVTDEMVESTVEQIRRENAMHVPVERPIEAGDYLMVELPGPDADKENTEQQEDSDVPAASAMPIDLDNVSEDFAKQFIGKNIGDTFELELESPASQKDDAEDDDAEDTDAEASDDDTPEVETPKLKVVIKDVKAKELPEADDEFAKTLGFDTWADADTRIRETLAAQLRQEGMQAQQEEFADKLAESVDFDIPKSLIDRRKVHLLENLQDDLKRRGMSMDDYLKSLEEQGTREEFEDELEETAQSGVKRDLVLETLMEQRKTVLPQEEFDAAVQHVAQQRGKSVAELKKEMGADWLTNYRFVLTRDKAVRDAIAELLGSDDAEVESEATAGDAPEEVAETADAE